MIFSFCFVQQKCTDVCFGKNIERHTVHTIGSWPNPKQWVIVHASDLIMIIRQSIYIISIIIKEMGKLKTHSPTYCIMDNWENMLNLTRTLDKLYLTIKFQTRFAQWWPWDGVMCKQTNTICKPKRIRLFALIINCTILMKTNSRFSRNVYTISDRIWCYTQAHNHGKIWKQSERWILPIWWW